MLFYPPIKKFFASSGANIFGMINLFSGGALERMSIFALNIMPYITSSIIMQLLEKNAEDRYASAYGIEADLRECLGQLKANGKI